MYRRLLFSLACCLLPAAFCPSGVFARDFTRGPLIISLEDKWEVSEEPGPELLKATLNKTVSLSLWKFQPGAKSAEQYVSDLRSDLGWNRVSEKKTADPRFGMTRAGLYQKTSAFDAQILRSRTYDFMLNGEIYLLEMIAPDQQFDASDTAFRQVFADMSNMSGAPVRGQVVIPAQAGIQVTPDKPGLDSRNRWNDGHFHHGSEPSPSSYTFIYEFPDGHRIGFDVQKKEAAVLDAKGTAKSFFAFSGIPYISSNGLFVLSDEYAYRIDPSNGNVIARLSLQEVLSATPAPVAYSPPPPPQSAPAPADRGHTATLQHNAPPGDPVQASIARADGIRRNKGVKTAIDYMMNERPAAERSGSPHLYEFYFRLGEYWEETGDLETALAYYRLATKAID